VRQWDLVNSARFTCQMDHLLIRAGIVGSISVQGDPPFGIDTKERGRGSRSRGGLAANGCHDGLGAVATWGKLRTNPPLDHFAILLPPPVVGGLVQVGTIYCSFTTQLSLRECAGYQKPPGHR